MTELSRKWWNGALGSVAVILALVLSYHFFPKNPLGTVRIGVVLGPQSGLVFLAEKLGYFKRQGVAVDVQTYPSNAATLDALQARKVDLASISDNLFVEKFVSGAPMVVLSQLYNAQRHSGLVVKKSSGILRLADLKGRRLALAAEAGLRFFLARMFTVNGLGMADVDVVSLPADEASAAFRSGAVSALATGKTAILNLEEELGEGTLRVFYTSPQTDISVLAGMSDVVTRRGVAMEAVLHGLAEALDFYLERRDDAYLMLLDILESRFTPTQMMQIWAFMDLDMSLSNVLLLNMREQETWYEEKLGLSRDADIESAFAIGLLRKVRPELVTIM